MTSKRIAIIGAGVAGLVAALELAAKGFAVFVVERGDEPGGKMRQITLDDTRIDSGPTVFTMRWVFDELFDEIGASFAGSIKLKPLDVLARHAWCDGSRLDLFADTNRSAEAIRAFAGRADMHGYLRFCADSKRIYELLEKTFIKSARPTVPTLVANFGLRGAADLLRGHPFVTMWTQLGHYFNDPRLRQLFGRYATYCGSSPFEAPATLMLVAHVEQNGVWSVDGGMQQLAYVIANAARERGATFLYGQGVREIAVEGGRATAIVLDSGERITADAIISNGDVAALAAGRFGTGARAAVRATPPSERSLSAITWTLHARTEGFPLARHTVFFSNDYAAEFDDIQRHGRPPRQPTVYVCAQDRSDADTGATAGAERLLLIINAPARGDQLAAEQWEIASCETNTFGLLERCGLKVERRPEASLVMTPIDFERLYPATGGALYGPASHGWAASFRREGSRSRLPGLYLAGGSTHPGPGVPMAALSGRQAATHIIRDLTSPGRFRLGAMLGGMSMR